MKWKKLFTIEGIRQLFDWTPVAVKAPKPHYAVYVDAGRMLLGYIVEVEYLYHGKQEVFFPTDSEKLGIVSQKRALANAISFYKNTRCKIKAYKKEREK